VRRPVVDIVIDNHNYARFLGRAIDSALAQTHPEVRVIVVDDGSTDDSRAVIARYGARVTAVLKPNGGQGSAINAGFAHGAGDVVIFLDSDDELLPQAAARAAAAFAADPSLVVVQYRMEVIDEHGRPTGEIQPGRGAQEPAGDLRAVHVRYPFDLAWGGMSCRAFARRALAEILPMPEPDFVTLADVYLRCLVPLYGPVHSLPHVLARYRRHGANSYARTTTALDLGVVRQNVLYGARVRPHIARHARRRGIERPRGPMLSVADLGHRMVSLKLAPAEHPIASDRVWRLALAGAVAPWRRHDLRWPVKLAFAAWFLVIGLSPRPLARPLAEAFAVPVLRDRIAPLLAALRRPSAVPAAS
jgi:glycosyltransferase involved in cell wall biosynthesis